MPRSSCGRRQGNTSVTEAATAAGYSNLSQFSRDYKVRFREAPSRTLADATTLRDAPRRLTAESRADWEC